MRASWVHKLYWCQKVKGTIACSLSLKGVNFWMPRKFVWTDPDDTTSLHKYIDALHTKDVPVTSVYEEKGLAVNHEYEEAPATEIIRIDPVKLLAILRGEYVLDVPCTAKLVMTDAENKTKYMPADVLAPLIALNGPVGEMYLNKLREMVAHQRPIMCLSEKELQSRPVQENNIGLWNPGQNIAVEETFSEDPAAATEQEQETEVSSIDHGPYKEVITSCKDYFIRRLLLDNKEFYAASSYDGKKWKICFLNQMIYDAVFQPETATP